MTGESERSESSSCKTDYSSTADQARKVFLINYKLGSGLSCSSKYLYLPQQPLYYYQVLINVFILLCRLFMKNIMPQKNNLATPREKRPTVYLKKKE